MQSLYTLHTAGSQNEDLHCVIVHLLTMHRVTCWSRCCCRAICLCNETKPCSISSACHFHRHPLWWPPFRFPFNPLLSLLMQKAHNCSVQFRQPGDCSIALFLCLSLGEPAFSVGKALSFCFDTVFQGHLGPILSPVLSQTSPLCSELEHNATHHREREREREEETETETGIVSLWRVALLFL